MWMFPEGRRRARETERQFLRRQIEKNCPKARAIEITKRVTGTNHRHRLQDAIFITRAAAGVLKIGDKYRSETARPKTPRRAAMRSAAFGAKLT